MDFAFDDDQELLRATTRRFLEENASLAHLRSVLETEDTFDSDGWRRGAELGWTALLVPEAHGGGSLTDQPLVDLVVLAEELGRVLHPGPFLPTNVVADALSRHGENAQRQAYLPRIASGELTAAWGLTGDGSADLHAVAVTVTPDGDNLRLDGVARFVASASIASLLLVTANSSEGLCHVAFPLPAEGVELRPLVGLDLSRRYADVRLDGVVVPRSASVGRPGAEAEALVDRALQVATVLQAAEAVGAADHLVHTTVQYAKDRVQFGRPIGSFQAIKHRLADLLITLEGMRAAAHYAALAVADGFDDAAEAVATAGSFVGDAYSAVAGEVVQLHGGIGFTWEHDAHLFIRRARVDEVLLGDPTWHRERLVRLLEAS